MKTLKFIIAFMISLFGLAWLQIGFLIMDKENRKEIGQMTLQHLKEKLGEV